MKNINFYQIKYKTMETFYDWVDYGSEFNIAAAQSMYYTGPMEEIYEIIMLITIGTRFARSGKKVSSYLKKDLKAILSKCKKLDFDEYTLTDYEKEMFKEEIKEVELLVKHKCILKHRS